MSENYENNWWKTNAVALLAIFITILSVAYWGVIKGNDDSNTIKAHTEALVELKAEIKALKSEKVDKETMTLIQLSLTEIKVDIRDIRLSQKYSRYQ